MEEFLTIIAWIGVFISGVLVIGRAYDALQYYSSYRAEYDMVAHGRHRNFGFVKYSVIFILCVIWLVTCG